MASMWTAASDLDYNESVGIFDQEDVIDPEYEHWLAEHGYNDPPTDLEMEEMRADYEAKHPSVRVVNLVEDDDISF